MELSEVKGLGPAKQESLKAAGIKTAEDLAKIDLRKDIDVPGVSKDALKTYKQRARQLMDSAPAKGAASSTKKSSAKSTKAPAKGAARKPAKSATKTTAKSAAKKPTTKTVESTPTAATSTTAGTHRATAADKQRQPQAAQAKPKGWLKRLLRR